MTTADPTPTLEELLDQERRLVLPSLDENDAVAFGLSLLRLASERDLPITIEVRLGGRVVFRAARNGTDTENDRYIAGKARIVERFGHSSLYERLQRERRLPVPEALGIARDVATALGYAHERGVLHRDVKPENILLARGRALIADFGLARAIGAADYTKLTATGVIVGTVYYMSPEQLREEPDLDQGADIYSLGCMLYEMLSGELPFTGRTLTDVANRILRGPIPAVRRLRPEVPGAVDEAIGRALAKARADRFRTMSEMLAALPV